MLAVVVHIVVAAVAVVACHRSLRLRAGMLYASQLMLVCFFGTRRSMLIGYQNESVFEVRRGSSGANSVKSSNQGTATSIR